MAEGEEPVSHRQLYGRISLSGQVILNKIIDIECGQVVSVLQQIYLVIIKHKLLSDECAKTKQNGAAVANSKPVQHISVVETQ